MKNGNNKIDGTLIEGTLDMSEQKELITESYTYFNGSLELEVKELYWNEFENEIYDELLHGEDGKFYFLATRGVEGHEASSFIFGLLTCDGWVTTFFYDNSYMNGTWGRSGPMAIRPIVSIPSSLIDTTTDYESKGMWDLKN